MFSAISLALINPISHAAEISNENAKTNTKTAFDELELFLHEQVNQALQNLGVKIDSLDQERKAILAEENEQYALKKANAFYNKYQPIYIKALTAMNLSEATIKEMMIQPQTTTALHDYLSIIRSTNRCTGELMMMMCNSPDFIRRGGCLSETYPMIYQTHFDVLPRANERTDRYSIYGHVDGTLQLWMNSIDTAISGSIGATINVRPTTGSMCVQTMGELQSIAVSTFRDHYFFSRAYSDAILAPKIKFSIAPTGRPADCAQQSFPFGTYNYAAQNEGGSSVVGGGISADMPVQNTHCNYVGAPSASEPSSNLTASAISAEHPYLIEDMANFSAPVNGAEPYTMQVYYQGRLRQAYSGGSTGGRLNFKFWTINVVQLPR